MRFPPCAFRHALSATCSYLAESPLVQQINFTNSGALRMTTTKAHDFLNRLTSIASVPSVSSVVSFAYDYNSANQRTLRREADGAYWRFENDSLGQVKSGRMPGISRTTQAKGQT